MGFCRFSVSPSKSRQTIALLEVFLQVCQLFLLFVCEWCYHGPSRSGALGAGLAIFSKYPIVATSIHPYSLNGSPLDVAGGDWFVGKSAASALVQHPVLGDVEVFNTHVSHLCQ